MSNRKTKHDGCTTGLWQDQPGGSGCHAQAQLERVFPHHHVNRNQHAQSKFERGTHFNCHLLVVHPSRCTPVTCVFFARRLSRSPSRTQARCSMTRLCRGVRLSHFGYQRGVTGEGGPTCFIGPSPPYITDFGARVARQRCPILRAGRTNLPRRTMCIKCSTGIPEAMHISDS